MKSINVRAKLKTNSRGVEFTITGPDGFHFFLYADGVKYVKGHFFIFVCEPNDRPISFCVLPDDTEWEEC